MPFVSGIKLTSLISSVHGKYLLTAPGDQDLDQGVLICPSPLFKLRVNNKNTGKFHKWGLLISAEIKCQFSFAIFVLIVIIFICILMTELPKTVSMSKKRGSIL